MSCAELIYATSAALGDVSRDLFLSVVQNGFGAGLRQVVSRQESFALFNMHLLIQTTSGL